MQRYSILWADDEIDLLKPHIMFLEQRGYDITPVNNASDAVELSDERHFDVVFLDEHMPGMSGLEALAQIKSSKPNLPVVMITKNEEEHIMEEAIGSKIADYLIKPLNPRQILLSVKKILDNKRLIIEKTNLNYQQEFRKISMAFMDEMNSGLIFIRNWCIGNCRWTSQTMKKWVMFSTCRRQKQMPTSPNLLSVIMNHGSMMPMPINRCCRTR
jgi:CheY-like chemotaxis protein